MQRRFLPLASLALPAYLALAACSPGDKGPAGNPETKTYAFKDFTRVKAETGIKLKLFQGPFAVSAESKNGDLSRLKVELRGEELSLSSDSHFSIGSSPYYSVSVAAPTYKAIDATAGVALEGDDLTLDDLSLAISAGVDARLSGTCKALTASVSAGASLKANNLKCAAATVTASAGAVADVYASQSATISASAGAKVSVDGHPPMVTKNADIAGVIEVKN
jgi:Putative auto-transporter adhesin, head GIN domain